MSDGFDYEAHAQWVADGHCDAVSGSKTWCNGWAGHGGEHFAPYFVHGKTSPERRTFEASARYSGSAARPEAKDADL